MQATRFANDVQEWRGETAKAGRFIFPFCVPPEAVQTSLPIAPQGVGPGFEPRIEAGTAVEFLDERRVEAALATLHEEQDIADAMAGLPPRERVNLSKSTPGTRMGDGSSCKRSEGTGNALSRGAGGTAFADEIALTKGPRAVDPEHNSARDRDQKGKGDRAREVLAVYKHRGAQLVLAQSRNKHPFRAEGVFCRPDSGEWAGQVIS